MTAAAHAQTAPYAERLRPQFHFTSVKDWINDPNGLVYFDGEYHLFAQRNPRGTDPGPHIAWRSWAHAVSTDLIHWEQLDDAISPGDHGSIWSGSAVIDKDNTAGFGKNAMVLFYTNAKEPFDQRIVHSTDRGRTFTPYSGNPVVKNIHALNRDPKVVWHAASGQWVMALYVDRRHEFVLMASKDLKQWRELHRLTVQGDDECPDFFPIKLDGREEKWVFMAANNRYLVGSFDGKTFTPETDSLASEHGPNFYAAQTFSDMPDGRRVQIGWMRGDYYSGMPFNQQLSFPCELTLRTTPRGPRLFRWPVRELESIRGDAIRLDQRLLTADRVQTTGADGDLFDIEADVDVAGGERFVLTVRGHPITFVREGNGGALLCWDRRVAVPPTNGRLKLRVVVDRTSLEIFANDGEVVLSGCFVPPADQRTVTMRVHGGTAVVNALTIHTLRPRPAGAATRPH